MAAWSNVSFGGKPLCELEKEDLDHFAHLDKQSLLKEVIGAGWVTFAGKGATEFGIAYTLTRIVNCIFHDENCIKLVG